MLQNCHDNFCAEKIANNLLERKSGELVRYRREFSSLGLSSDIQRTNNGYVANVA